MSAQETIPEVAQASAHGSPKAHPLRQFADVLGVVTFGVLIWQATYWAVGGTAVSSPATTVEQAIALLRSPSFHVHLGATAYALLLSFVFAVVIGIPLGLALGFRRFSGEVFEPVLASLYTIPKVTLYPLVLAIFGLGLSARVAFGVMHAIIPMVLITMGAVRAIRPVHLKTAAMLRLSPTQVATSILIPSVLPEIITALRVGFSLSLLGVLVGEMFASQRGLGFLLIKGITTFEVSTSIAITVMLVAFSVVTGATLLAIDRRFHARGTQRTW
jgi:NitT/TauT family transport system permease protein